MIFGKCGCRSFNVYENDHKVSCAECGKMYEVLDIMNKYEDEKLRKIRTEHKV